MEDDAPNESFNDAPNERRALNQENEERNMQNQNAESLPSIAERPTNLFQKVFFILLAIPRFIAIVFFSIFDTKCIVEDKASVVDCQQQTFVRNPEHWVLAWLVMSIVSSGNLLYIGYRNQVKLNYMHNKAKQIYKKGSFGSLMFLLLITTIYYGIRIYSTSSTGLMQAISWFLFLWPFVTVLLVCGLNYLPRVRLQGERPRCCTFAWFKFFLIQNLDFVIYWLALLLYFFEVACKLAAVMLDVALQVAPLIQSKFPEESSHLRGVMVLVVGFRLVLHARLLSFFWQKLFHGEKDLFSEPRQKLEEESLAEYQEQQQQQEPRNAQQENIPMEENNCS